MDAIEIMRSMEPFYGNDMAVPQEPKDKARRLCWEYNMSDPLDTEKREAILEELLGTFDKSVVIRNNFQCDYGFNIHFHGFAFVNYNCTIIDTSPVNIGANTFIAPNVCISCTGHPLVPEQRNTGTGISSPVTLEGNNWIGANVVICPGVTIGEGSTVGAGSVVTRDIPAGVVAYGTPCKPIHVIGEDDRIDLSKALF